MIGVPNGLEVPVAGVAFPFEIARNPGAVDNGVKETARTGFTHRTDVRRVQIERLLLEEFDSISREHRLPRPARPEDEGMAPGVVVGEWLETRGERVQLGFAVMEFVRDERGLEGARVLDHDVA